ncbi:hypothetical protein CMV_018141 [Castanea mollissima]|uniref:Uncharacterized protein n=1 Tax=Castanea mollissima TaxID=60419 RepID=A0A8J4R0G0_9ROSI|nr:hypothetical protein CMV_018141 [Castanea mollissima]
MWSGGNDNCEPNITNCFVLFWFEVCYFTHNIIVIAFFNFAFVLRHRTRLATLNKALTLTTAPYSNWNVMGVTLRFCVFC